MGKFPEEEADSYAKAERLRAVILAPYEKQVDRASSAFANKQEAREETSGELDISTLEWSFSKVGHGLVAVDAFESATETVDIINGLSEVLFSWRTSILEMLSTSVAVSEEEQKEIDADADPDDAMYYGQRAETQEKLNCYIQAYQALLAEIRKYVTGEATAL